MEIHFKKTYVLLLALAASSCATYNSIYKKGSEVTVVVDKAKPEHTFYFVGDAGYFDNQNPTPALKALKQQLSNAPKNSTVVFLGDNIYPAGMPPENHKTRKEAETFLNMQLDVVAGFKGNVVFIPGNHDWYSDGLNGLKRQEKYIENRLGKDTFLPEDGCPLKRVEISENINLLLLDTQWYLADWDKHPEINEDCNEITNREAFFDKVRSEIAKANGKTLIIAMHHPLATNGEHGGRFSFKKNIMPFKSNIPVPVMGNLANYLRKTSGASPQDANNVHYRTLMQRLKTLAQGNNNIVFVSGHEHSLQYILEEGLPVIVSGAGAKNSAVALGGNGLFASGQQGFVKFTVGKNQYATAEYFVEGNNFSQPVFSAEVFKPTDTVYKGTLQTVFPETTKASVYNGMAGKRGKFYTSFWGKHYRDLYTTSIEVKNANLDTLYGGVKPVRIGGGQQTKSLRVENEAGNEYTLRALKKSALRLIQSNFFKNDYVLEDYSGTVTEDLVQDFYTTAHPFAALAVPVLSDAAGIFHTNPQLLYVPKQPALKGFNETYGDELYLVEEQVGSENKNVESFGSPDDIIDSDELFEALAKNTKHQVDSKSYIRARLLDMVLGDWDRHKDQWRWAKFEDKEVKVYKPIPRDRDQVFSTFDGAFFGIATRLVPILRKNQKYSEEIRNLKWFNYNPYPLDLALINNHSQEDWLRQAALLKDKLTSAVIDQALGNLPKEVQGESLSQVKKTLLYRVQNIEAIAKEYYFILKKYPILKATNKKDWILVERLPNNQTRIQLYTVKDDTKEDVYFSETYSGGETREIWVYGLEDDDIFEVKGNGHTTIKLKLIGGQNHDVYTVENNQKLEVVDYKSKQNTFTNVTGKILSDSYDLNNYSYYKYRSTTNQVLPLIGANPDDGLKLGAIYTYTLNGLKRNPFTTRHKLTGAYYFATKGFELLYNGEFANVFGKWNLGMDAQFTSPNFAINFFGFGNDSQNDTSLDFDFNRVRLSTFRVNPKLVWRGHNGAYFKAGAFFEVIEVEETEGRFINQAPVNNRVFSAQNFFGTEVNYGYENFNDPVNPTLGMAFDLVAGYKQNVDVFRNFAYIIPQLRFTSPVINSEKLVFATKFKGHFNIGNGFEFYQAAMIGGVDGLRAYRNQRFNGRTAFYQNTDLRYNITKVKTGVLPANLGIFTGFDHGRVWVANDTSNNWHTSVGGGVYFNALGLFTANASLFNADDGNRFAFAMLFNF